MKKIIFAAVAVFAFGTINAQTEETSAYKPTKGTVTTEVGLVGGLNNANFNLNTGLLKFRYFLKDDMALRLGLGIDNAKTETITGTSPNQLTTTIKNNGLDFKVGIEKHFAGSDRLSTYAGADLVYGSGKISNDASNENGNYNRTETPNSNFGFNLFTGADYYIAKKLYLGVEAGLSILSNKVKDTSSSIKVGATTTDTTTPGNKTNTLNTNVFGGVRIGFQF